MVDFEHSVWSKGEVGLGTQKVVLRLKNKTEGISLMSSETGSKLWFMQHSPRRAGREGPRLPPARETSGPVGLQELTLHTQLCLCMVTSDQRSYSMQCICFKYRDIEKIFIEI